MSTQRHTTPPCPILPISISSHSQTSSHERILTLNIYISIFQLIAALLLTLMLLWHISTVSLVENYMMPAWWVEEFLATHANGWRVGVWTIVGALVVLDCLHALLILDWWCAMSCRYQGGGKEWEQGSYGERTAGEEWEKQENGDALVRFSSSEQGTDRAFQPSTRHSSFFDSAVVDENANPATTNLPHTNHPLLHPRLPLVTQLVLISILDILMMLVLASHNVTYFVSLPTALEFCSHDRLLARPVPFGVKRVLLSERDRCIGLNVDIHVARGFAVFMAMVLGLLHLAALTVRICECVQFGREGVVPYVHPEQGTQVGVGDVVIEELDTRPAVDLPFRPRSNVYSSPSTDRPRAAASIDAEERSTSVNYVDWSAVRAEQRRRREVRTDESGISKSSMRWSEALLECLLP
ncbi:pre-mRNA-splicing factor 8 [Curvularia kusanoi]|uniref:Pre-mRNA-splicing factor 8 n=1 Tax=Curvularia kusanoi TaxID=90978 RepID=A0A9P4TG18_CURKU|nr:pre-mRNA-splicing factor 8 [Curvularia kusanoi]